MAAKPQDPLDALQLLLNEALVQTGKALRASRRDAQGNFTQPQSLNNSKIPDTIRAFHTALDDLESNIVQAKSVMQRDLNQVRANKPQQQQPQPDPVPKQEIASPMVVQMTSPPQPPAINGTAGMASLAGLSTGATTNGDTAPKAEGDGSGAAGSATQTSTKEEPKAEGSSADQSQGASADANFTDMAFAPPDDQNQFDLSAFASTENMDEMLSLENLIPAATTDKPDETKKEGETTGDAGNTTGETAASTTSAPSAEASLANMFTDSGQTDGMDFDFSIGGGGEETFDDLMNTRDDTFEMMDNDFDAAFFGLDGENAS